MSRTVDLNHKTASDLVFALEKQGLTNEFANEVVKNGELARMLVLFITLGKNDIGNDFLVSIDEEIDIETLRRKFNVRVESPEIGQFGKVFEWKKTEKGIYDSSIMFISTANKAAFGKQFDEQQSVIRNTFSSENIVFPNIATSIFILGTLQSRGIKMMPLNFRTSSKISMVKPDYGKPRTETFRMTILPDQKKGMFVYSGHDRGFRGFSVVCADKLK